MKMWIKLIFAIFSCSWVVFAADIIEVCPESEIDNPKNKITLPPVPAAYHALVQVISSSLQTTLNLEYAALGGSYFRQVEQGNAKAIAIYDKKRGQLIKVAERSHKLGEEACLVETLNDQNGWDVGKIEHKNITMTGADWYLRYTHMEGGRELKADDLGRSLENGVEVQTYGLCLTWAEINAFVYMKINMAVTNKWTNLHGGNDSVPTSVWTNTSVNGELSTDFVTFFDYEKDVVPDGIFNVPDDCFCFGLKTVGVRTIPELPMKFSYQSEIITKASDYKDLIVYQNHIFDSEMNFTRFDYRLIDQAEKYDIGHAHPLEGVLTQIHDFYSGLSYTFDPITGKCDAVPIPLTSDDVKVINGKKVIITTPMEYLGLTNLNYTFYKEERRRGIDALQFRAYDNKAFLIHEYWFASAKEVIQESHMYNHMQPMAHIQYNIWNPDLNRTVTNFFNFDADRPNIHLYDVYGCFKASEKRRFLFQMKGTLDILNITNFQYLDQLILVAITQNSMLSPLRVSHIETVSAGSNTDIIFTILEKKNIEGDGNINDNELTTDKAIEMFKSQLNNGYVKIGIPSATIQSVDTVYDSFQEVTQLSTPAAVSSGYSGGSMALLGIGMIIFGLLIGFGVIYYLKGVRKPSDNSFEPKRFVNDDAQDDASA